MKELKVFTSQEVLGKEFNIYGDSDAPLFLAKDVAEWIDHSDRSKMLKAVDEDEKVKNIVPTLGGSQEMWFLTEYGLYEVLMQSRKPIAKQFKKEVKAILKQLRTTGVVITEKAAAEDINYESMFGNYRIRKTFRQAKDVKELYQIFIEENKKNRIKAANIISKNNLIVMELEDKINPLNVAKGGITVSEVVAIQELISDIKDRTLELSNRRNGGLRSAKTKEIKSLKGVIDSMKEPTLEMYNQINYAPLSLNKMFDGEGSIKHRSPLYNYWIENFPIWEVEDKELWELNGVDFTKPLHIRLGFVCHELNDVDNLCKSAIDMVLGRIYGINDVLVHKITADKLGTNNDKLGQKIYIHISNL